MEQRYECQKGWRGRNDKISENSTKPPKDKPKIKAIIVHNWREAHLQRERKSGPGK